MKPFVLVVPSLKISGGNKEALRLLDGLVAQGGTGRVLSLWRNATETRSCAAVDYLTAHLPSAARAALDYPRLLWRFARRQPQYPGAQFIFTHYATFPLALFVDRSRRLFFVQDLEWRFLGDGTTARVLRYVILWFYRRGGLIAANRYLADELGARGLQVDGEWPVWADPRFADVGAAPVTRSVDVVMVLRKGAHKRLDLYQRFLQGCASRQGWRLAVITPDDAIAASLQGLSHVECLLRPSVEQMRALYGRSKLLLHLSDHEGFGLPPLEAMGAGCLALCRDSGGVRAFMRLDDALLPLLFDPQVTVAQITARVQALLSDPPQLAARASRARRVFHDGMLAAERGRMAEENRLLSEHPGAAA